eukprot:PhF_6_TR6073/c0_g1_i5/m.8828
MRLPQAIALRVFCRGPVSIRFCASSCAILAFNSDITTSFLSHCALQSCRVKINSVFPTSHAPLSSQFGLANGVFVYPFAPFPSRIAPWGRRHRGSVKFLKCKSQKGLPKREFE